ncbi:hypothetical protein [Clostridium sp.]|uniref:hypothetical protein n=1 Tax=Clostridium sp. TaxID=1506 RepID=UPI003D6CFF93
MTILGEIIYETGKIVGNTAEYSIKKTGSIISTIAEISGKNKLAQNTVKYSTIVSKMVGKTTKITAAVTAVLVDKTIDGTVNAVKYIAENAVETSVKVYGQSDKFYDEDKYIEADYIIIDE